MAALAQVVEDMMELLPNGWGFLLVMLALGILPFYWLAKAAGYRPPKQPPLTVAEKIAIVGLCFYALLLIALTTTGQIRP